MIKAVIFDLDNTLYDYDECNAPAMEKIAAVGAELFGCDKQKFLTTYDAAKTEVKRHFDPKNAAQHSRVFYIQKAAELSGVSPVGTLLPLYAAYWDTFIDAMRPYEGAAEFLRVLKENGIKTAICTDMTAYIQFRKIEKLGFASLIDAIVTSEEAGAEKPFPVNFHIALDKVGVRPAEALYVGDSWAKDVTGAQNVGITPIWFTARREFTPQEGVLQISDYTDKRLYDACGLQK